MDSMPAVVPLSVLGRMRGLLGTHQFPKGPTALVLVPCSSLHTVGMRYPIDVVWLNRDLSVCGICRGVSPGRIVRGPEMAVAAIELPVGGASRWRSSCGLSGRVRIANNVRIAFGKDGGESEGMPSMWRRCRFGGGDVLRVSIQFFEDGPGQIR